MGRQYVERVLENDSNNQEALLLSAVISRKKGKIKEAEKDLGIIESLFPLNHFARFEKMLLKKDKHTENNFTSMIRNELPQETYMEMALWYEYIGCNNVWILITKPQ
jgi:hypothetical protein